MNEKLFGILFKSFLAIGALLFATGIWYYTIGKKPKLIVSAPIASKAGLPTSHMVAPGEVLLLVGTKATLYDVVAGTEKWSSDRGPAKATPTPAPVAAAAPVSVAAPKPVAAPPEKHDPKLQILRARVHRRSEKLDRWAAELNSKREKLNTALKIASFKEEEAKYQAEVVEAHAEAAALQQAAAGAPIELSQFALTDEAISAEPREVDVYEPDRKEVFSDAATIGLAQGKTVRILDHANGRLTKEIPLAGNFTRVMRGGDCWYVVAAAEDGTQQITCISARDGAAKAINVAGAVAEPRVAWAQSGRPAMPTVQAQRTEFSANGAELAQLDVRLIEKKITERQALKSDSASDWEAADKNTTGGWGKDAAIIAQTMANDAQREATGGKELIDESSYEVVLRRPFSAGVPDSAATKVEGRAELFSTPTFDLVAAGHTLIAFDHANKKLWEARLAFPVAATSFMEDADASGPGTVSQPCLEDDKRLYFFDRGFLTAFDRQSGATLWRFPSVGIRKVQLDSAALYVTSANGNAETLRYSQEATGPTLPLIIKLEAGSGKILWKQEKYEDCFVSGGNVYAALEARNPGDLVNAVFERSKAIETRFKLYKLSTRDGHAQWEWFQTRRPLRIEADKKKVSLLFSDELQVLTSRAL